MLQKYPEGKEWDPEFLGFQVTTDKKHERFLKRAYMYGLAHSTDLATKLGSILTVEFSEEEHAGVEGFVDNGMLELHYGTNHIPHDVDLDIEDFAKRPEKYAAVHAERDAIFKAVRKGVTTSGTTLYAPWASCFDCGQAIAEAGIKTLVTHETAMLQDSERWRDLITKGVTYMADRGVELLMYRGDLGMDYLFDQKFLKM